MKTRTRAILTLYILFVIVFCILIILSAYDPSVAQVTKISFNNIYEMNAWTYVWLVVCAVFIIVGVCLLFFKPKENLSQNVLLTTTTGGKAYISTKAIDEVAHRFLAGVDGTIENSIRTKCAEVSTVVIHVDISVKPDILIIDVTNKISGELDKFVEKYVGIVVKDVIIKVSPLKVSNAK